MHWIEFFLAGLVGLVTSLGVIPVILQVCRRHGVASRAGEAHHGHRVPVPRLGGIAFAAALLVVTTLFCCWNRGLVVRPEHWVVIGGSLAMFGLGLWDDLSAIGARRKLLGQILIASLAYLCGIGIVHFRIPISYQLIDLGYWSWPVTVFWLVAMTNLINLIDGVDGLAGGISLMLMALLVYVTGQEEFTPILAAGMVGALLGFLRYNFPPARIYMGDGGAYFLGFLIGCQAIVGSQKGTIFAALVAPLFALALPIIDTALAILRRGAGGLPVFRPDRKHLHHRLLAQGHSRRNVVLGFYAFTAFFLVLGFLVFYWHGQYFALLIGVGTLAVILAAGRFSFSREWFSVGRVLGNSMEARADIHYALCLSRCLAAEGARVETLAELAEDVIFIARKLDFSRVRMRLEDDEKCWELDETRAASCQSFKLPLAGHRYCFLEVFGANPEAQPGEPAFSVSRLNTYSIQADLLGEGWSKAVNDWQRKYQLPPRFDARPSAPTAVESPAPLAAGARPLPSDK